MKLSSKQPSNNPRRPGTIFVGGLITGLIVSQFIFEFDWYNGAAPIANRRSNGDANYSEHFQVSEQTVTAMVANRGSSGDAVKTGRPLPQAVMDCWPYLVGNTILGSRAVNSSFIVNIGANDGKSLDETWFWLGREDAEGLAIECHPKTVPKLIQNYRQARNRVKIVTEFATPDSIVRIFKEAAVPEELFLLKIDVDSYDVDIIETVLAAGYRPVLVFVEINEKIPPPFRFTVKYAKESTAKQFYWQGGHLFGASLMSWADCFERQDYKLLGLQYGNNLLYARKDLVRDGLGADPSCSYVEGYYHPFTHLRSTRAEKYKWNEDVTFFFDFYPEKWKDASQLMKAKLIETSPDTMRKNQAALRQSGDNLVMEWPNVPNLADTEAADFKRSCERLEARGAPRVKLDPRALRQNWQRVVDGISMNDDYSKTEASRRGFNMNCNASGLV